MIEAHPHELIVLGADLQEHILGHPEILDKTIIANADCQQGLQTYQVWEMDCKLLGLRASSETCKRILEVFHRRGSTYGEWRQLDRELLGRLRDELKSDGFFYVPPEKTIYYDLPAEGVSNIASSFPSAMFEFEEAGKCYATGRNTGCVFHSMRALEIGLNTLGMAFSVSTDRNNWENIINEIEAQIRKVGPSMGGGWKDDEKFYSEAALQFRFFKNAWRNHTMHVRDVYDEQQAKAIFDHVREFMTHLAGRLHEPV